MWMDSSSKEHTNEDAILGYKARIYLKKEYSRKKLNKFVTYQINWQLNNSIELY